jgi:hypothetical protein
MMRKQCLRILIALFCVVGSGMAARAQTRDQIAVTIPFEFVVAGKTLPAGTYKVSRVTDTDPRPLLLHSFEKRTSAIVLPSQVEGGSADKVHLSFEWVGGQYFLRKIATADNVFTIRVPRLAIMEAAVHNSTSASGGSGSN